MSIWLGILYILFPLWGPGLVVFGQWLAGEPWLESSLPGRYIWYPVWFVAAMVVAVLALVVVGAVKLVMPVRREVDGEVRA